MRATSFLLGCLLSFGIVVTAAASGETHAGSAGAGASGNCNGSSSSSDRASSHDTPGATNNGDALGGARGNNGSSSQRRGDAAPSTESDVPRFGDDASPNHSSHGAGLSWQSLLPGSIQ